MIRALLTVFILGLFSQSTFGQPAELQLAEDSRTSASDARTAAKDSRLECENLSLACQAWIAVVAPISWADAISFQSTLNVINKTRPTRSESEGEIPYSQGLQYLASAKLAWQLSGDAEAARELAEMSIESYAEAETIFGEVLSNNEEKIQLLKGFIFHVQQFLGIGERVFT